MLLEPGGRTDAEIGPAAGTISIELVIRLDQTCQRNFLKVATGFAKYARMFTISHASQ
jgi:hypothetical protein